MNVAVPASVEDGQELSLRIEADQEAFLVVYYRDAEGKGQVLWPSEQESAPQVKPGAPVFLPSEKERRAGVRLVAALADPARAARETLVVYAPPSSPPRLTSCRSAAGRARCKAT